MAGEGVVDGVGVAADGGVKDLPARGGEDVLVAVVPGALDELGGVRLVLLDGGVADEAHVVVDVKVEERPRLAARAPR